METRHYRGNQSLPRTKNSTWRAIMPKQKEIITHLTCSDPSLENGPGAGASPRRRCAAINGRKSAQLDVLRAWIDWKVW